MTRTQIEQIIYKVFDNLDSTGYNTKMYKEKFKKMNNKQFKDFINNPDEDFFLEVEHFTKNNLKLADIEKAASVINVPLQEYIYLPFENEADPSNPIKSLVPVCVGYIHVKRVQQILSKKNSFSINIESRNMKTNQITSSDKNGRVSDSDNFVLMAINANYAAKEFLAPRADDMVMKQKMIAEISQKGYVQLKDLPDSIDNKQSLNLLDVYFMGASLKTNLTSSGLAFRRTLKNKQIKTLASKKYEDKVSK